jgi:ATP/maltotriose-dependent transcriptional regulator MalT
VIAALQTIAPGIGAATQDMLRSPRLPPIEFILTVLVNDLCSLASNVILVLDDYHAIDAAAVHNAIAFLLDHLPPQVHVVIATRADPPLPLARWRSRGQSVEIRTDDLRFTTDEAGAFLRFIQSFSGSHRYVLDYLAEEVLNRQPESVQTFLLQTSILERLCGPLRDEVIGIREQGAGIRRNACFWQVQRSAQTG